MEDGSMDTLELMRSQIAILKDKLSDEKIVNERLFKKVVKSSVRTINTQAWISVAASVFVILYSLFAAPKMGLSVYFTVFTILLMLFCDAVTLYSHRNVNGRTMTMDMKTVAEIMRRLKNFYLDWLKYGIVLVLFWGSWFCTELILMNSHDNHAGLYMAGGAIVGLVMGGLLGLKMHRTVINSCDDVLSQIDRD